MEKILIALLSCAVAGCSTAAFGQPYKDNVTLTGWASIRGEVLLYDSKEAMIARDHSRCISAVFDHQQPDRLTKFESKKVVLSGWEVEYRLLPNEDAPILQRKILGHSIIPNFCLKEKVVLISSMRILKQ